MLVQTVCLLLPGRAKVVFAAILLVRGLPACSGFRCG